MIKFCYLNITTFGVKHYYGCLSYEGYKPSKSSFDISKKMTKKEADAFNEYDKWKSYRAGDITTRINTKKEIITIAKKIWKKKFPKAQALVLGRSGVAQPQEIVDTKDKNLMKENNKLFNELEKIYKLDNDLRKPESLNKHREICNKWYKLVGVNYVY